MTTTASNQTAELDLDKLEALAKAATPGPWRASQNDVFAGPRYRIAQNITAGGSAKGMADERKWQLANTDFIAAANPATVRALIAQARATGTQGASDVPTWQERLNAEGLYDNGTSLFGGWSAGTMARDAEIADLRAQLALQRKGEPAEGGAFPERDPSKPAEQQGLLRKFDVRRVDGSDQPGGKHHGCRYYVLDLNHDQHAPAAMRAYAAACRATHPHLADDIEAEFGAAPQASREVPEGWRAGVEAVAAMLRKDVEAFDLEHARQESDTGAWYFRTEAHEAYSNAVHEWLDNIKEMLAAAPSPASAEDGEKQDAVVEANRQLLLERSRVGVKKYGVTLAEAGHTPRELARHALEEVLDLANYLQAIIQTDAAQLDGSQKAGGAA